MIVGDLKPLEEIISAIKTYKKVLVLGCGSCVTVCLSGGEREAKQLSHELAQVRHYQNAPPKFEVDSILRQCERDLVIEYQNIPEGTDAVLSLACGAGVQTLADALEPLPVIPALNTTFLGASDKAGIWAEKCKGCGDCILIHTGGICPVARCAKSLFNGPCGGSQGGYCEVGQGIPCAWTQIVARLKKMDKLHSYEEIRTSKDWRPGGAEGVRKRVRTGLGNGSNKNQTDNS
ncbi:MAG: methylenetetrahydrofolate reductase C-terminal domain-containing protein [Desulfobacteraceae bacterium]|jgi:ferredoxin